MHSKPFPLKHTTQAQQVLHIWVCKAKNHAHEHATQAQQVPCICLLKAKNHPPEHATQAQQVPQTCLRKANNHPPEHTTQIKQVPYICASVGNIVVRQRPPPPICRLVTLVKLCAAIRERQGGQGARLPSECLIKKKTKRLEVEGGQAVRQKAGARERAFRPSAGIVNLQNEKMHKVICKMKGVAGCRPTATDKELNAIKIESPIKA